MQKSRVGFPVLLPTKLAGTNRRRAAFAIFLFLAAAGLARAESAAEVIRKAVARSGEEGVSLADVILQVERAASSAQTDSDRRSLYTFLGSLTERAGLYEAASRWYASAAGIAAPPAEGTQAMTSEQLVLAAVRASLGFGDYETAESYLSSVRGSRNQETLAYVRLYTVWAWLCRAETPDDLVEPLALLESYAAMESMRPVHPVVYLTLWHLTQDGKWKERLSSEYPSSPEMSVVSGGASVLPSPFWYFLPRDEAAHGASTAEASGSGTTDKSGQKEQASEAAASGGIVCHQLGFFRNKENASGLMERVRAAGFDPTLSEERRSSGTVYYVVTVPDDGTDSMGLRLKTAGFESYPVFAE